MIWGNLQKLQAQAGTPVQYQLVYGDQRIELNQLLGKVVSLAASGRMNCVACQREIPKTFQNGYCFPCTQKLAQCDLCIVKPELCHYADGTCREPQWGEAHCMIPHYVYLANASGLKVGITRHTQLPTRWLDQGAVQGLPIFKVGSRFISGLVEKLLSEQTSDKTNWRAMLKGEAGPLDLVGERDRLMEYCESGIEELEEQFGDHMLEFLEREPVQHFEYPVLEYPQKPKTLSLDGPQKTVEGVLLGIKGQYLILDQGVLNIRKHIGYQVQFQTRD